MSSAKELYQNGWEKMGTYDEPRLSELVDLYKDLGFKICLLPFQPDLEEGCKECMKANPENYKTIFIKRE